MAQTTSIEAETYQCPLCAEKDYILVIKDGETVLAIYCLSCGYDASNSVGFITL